MGKFWLSLFLFAGIFQIGFCQLNLKGTIWNRPELQKVPGYSVLEQDSVMAIIYQGLPYKKHPQPVFAYYATPGLLSGDRSKDVNLPAVVLVHGGGGKAFRQWAVRLSFELYEKQTQKSNLNIQVILNNKKRIYKLQFS